MKIERALLLILSFLVSGQYVFSQNVEYTFKHPGDSTREYYITIHPPGEIKGCIVLLNGYGEVANHVYKETKIPQIAAKSGIMTIIPTLTDWSCLFVDENSQKLLDDFIEEVS